MTDWLSVRIRLIFRFATNSFLKGDKYVPSNASIWNRNISKPEFLGRKGSWKLLDRRSIYATKASKIKLRLWGVSRSKFFNLLLWQRINYTVSPTDIDGKWHAPLSSSYFGCSILSSHIRRASRLQFACLAVRDPKLYRGPQQTIYDIHK
jgi:hypothetical protein